MNKAERAENPDIFIGAFCHVFIFQKYWSFGIDIIFNHFIVSHKNQL